MELSHSVITPPAVHRWVQDGLVHQPQQFDQAFNYLFAKEMSDSDLGAVSSQQPDAWSMKQFWNAGRTRPALRQKAASSEIQSRYCSDFQVIA